MTTKQFHLGDILSITTDRLVSPDHIGGVYSILNFMTGDNLFTHQLPRACEECKPHLLAQHPDLAGVPVPERFGESRDEAQQAVDAWLAEQVDRYGEYRDVTPLAAEEHTSIDPLAELAMNYPSVPVIPIVAEESS